MTRAVALGSISTQTDGRLLVVGGAGKSASYTTPETPISGVANNDTWYDDVCDGPVTAEVTIGAPRRPRPRPGPWSRRRTTRPA